MGIGMSSVVSKLNISSVGELGKPIIDFLILPTGVEDFEVSSRFFRPVKSFTTIDHCLDQGQDRMSGL